MENIYAALLLHKAGKDISEANLMKVLAAAGAESDESQVKSLVVSLKGVDIEKELESATLAAAAPAGAVTAPAKKEEAPKEEKHEEAAEG
ncbi:MAG: 50S ribosomal protein P1, partial [Nanoarchaeota archaeon]